VDAEAPKLDERQIRLLTEERDQRFTDGDDLWCRCLATAGDHAPSSRTS
jgi:hypothetical protein